MGSFTRLTAAIAAAVCATTTAAAAIEVSTTAASGAFAYTLGNATYYSPAAAVVSGCFADSKRGSTELLPLTVLETDQMTVTADVLVNLTRTYASLDDVWTPNFLSDGALVLLTPPGAVLDASAGAWIIATGTRYLLPTTGLDISSFGSSGVNVFFVPGSWDLKPGPYTFSIGPAGVTIRQTYALHRDRLEAFVFGTTPVPGLSAYAQVDLVVSSYQDAWIPVPSRLYSLGDGRPLAGVRVALKDIYDLEGVQTGGGSRSYAEVYAPPNKTAVSVQKLLDLGAVIVGKTKTSQFAHGADPWQFLDIHYPWNPRGDGYLTAASSSSGSAAAIAGYDWIDIALGSDTRGSVRKPAALVGSYGIRPTWGSMDLTGVIPLATEMDTAGFFARDPALFTKVAGLWFHDSSSVPVNKTFTRFPSKIIYPVDYFPLRNPAAQTLFDSFLATLETEFGMLRTQINLTTTLRSTVSDPAITNSTTFQLSSNRLAEYVSYHQVGVPLAEKWTAAFPGAGYPPLDPNPRAAFNRSASLTPSDYDAAVALKNKFKDYFLSTVLRPNAETCSEGIMVLDMGTGGLPSYREQALNALPGATALSVTIPAGGPNMPSNYLASTAGCPEVGIPVGQVSYRSEISLQEEMIPVSVDLVAAPGCDGMLLELTRRLAELGVAKTVRTGRTAF
ncbi:amidase signature enzyme [Coniochaeta ligniaria NRRL 30616]|uniref:Amidase signature enzyme n=1 Tax=Coniochaeta ligniaria NRRL 30616 TaxID=1408157 RepID=A0A1J7JF06_9PEZI|nr:amidase signature enzyme [Coniochaeta ligniaria NRRL 30616]